MRCDNGVNQNFQIFLRLVLGDAFFLPVGKCKDKAVHVTQIWQILIIFLF